MNFQKVLIAGKWRESQNPVDHFNAVDPAKKQKLPEIYPVSGTNEVVEAIEAGKKAAVELRNIPRENFALFLESFADRIDANADELVVIANLETALPKEPRLRNGELPRTTDQLRKAAKAARELNWCHATIDSPINIRSKMGPLDGPVAVFGPNNFPFAFNSIAGGDFAAAVAAGNPVIAKANTGHPGTTLVFARLAFDAVVETGLPPATVQMLYRTPPELGLQLVSHPDIGASAFTGSKTAGLKLKAAADKAGKPIYLEMSSVNPVFILPRAVEERFDEIATELFGSCALGAGQFCTNPGLMILQKSDLTEQFIRTLAEIFDNNRPGVLLSPQGPDGIGAAVEILKSAGAEVIAGGNTVEDEGYRFANTLLRVDGKTFISNPLALQTEAFGTASLIVVADDFRQMKEVASVMEGNLTGCIYSHTQGKDDTDYTILEPELRPKVGRLLNDKVPTGVAVVSSMNHGGPYPATGHPGFTAVGLPASMLRFAALYCYDNVRPNRLPIELQDKNPTGSMWRLIDGEWTQRDV
ncbi:MAG: aldehyde dehydrogenase (NADP(+)) [Sedimentisphaerales bacterium]|nr:aldehyde dehydrogenase (NADP(+)) [Sedimentisphaerales bacterium]